MSLDFGLQFEGEDTKETCELYERNITHNVANMWGRAGIFNSLYNSGGKKAKEELENLREGLKKMEDSPAEYRKLDPENGWGDYDSALEFLREVVSYCAKYPNSIIWVSK